MNSSLDDFQVDDKLEVTEKKEKKFIQIAYPLNKSEQKRHELVR